MEYKFSDAVLINPKESLKKGAIAKKIAMADIQENYRFIKNFELNKFKGGTKFRNGDTLFARITPCLENGKIVQVNILEENEVAFGSTEFLVLRDKEGVTIPDYVYYLSKWDYIKNNAIKSMTGTSGRQRVQNSIFDELVVDIPSIETQKRIVSVLNNLDYKIEINNKIIENLEAQAQAIFKSWFVDFEPFQDGNFIESELGLIPEGWEVVKFGDLFKFQKGKKPKSLLDYGKEGSVPYIVKGVIDGSESPSYTLDEKIIKIENMDIFMLMDGANAGNIYYGYNGALGSTFSFLNIEDLEYREFIYCFLKSNENYIRNQNTGSAIPHANKDFINNIRFALPKNISKLNILNYFKVIRTKVITLKLENQTLAQTRDTLLPKLISGEIDVYNIKIDDEDTDYE